MIPRSAQSSLSHWTTTRPGIVAGSSGTTSSSRPAQSTMPPECWPRWRGSPTTACQSAAKRRIRASARSAPTRWRCRAGIPSSASW